MPDTKWIEVGLVDELKQRSLQPIVCGQTKLALSYKDGRFAAISGACNHVGGPLDEGRLDGDYVVCPWHYWKFHHRTGQGEPGDETDQVATYSLKEENGRLQLDSQIIKLRDLSFRPCEGFYSTAAEACTWPCSITQMDPTDQMVEGQLPAHLLTRGGRKAHQLDSEPTG